VELGASDHTRFLSRISSKQCFFFSKGGSIWFSVSTEVCKDGGDHIGYCYREGGI